MSLAADRELVDVVDEDDRVIDTVTRREIRARNLLHRCTYVLLRNAAGQILVHRRTDTKDVHPGAYDVFAGGVCAAGESYDDCARREAAEELGVDGAALRFLFRHPLPRLARAGVGRRLRGVSGIETCATRRARWPGARGSTKPSSTGCSASCPSVQTHSRSSRAGVRSEPTPYGSA
jgi:hypothetical protein